MLTQASMDKSNKTLLKLLTDKDPLTIIESQTQDLKPSSNLVHPEHIFQATLLKANADGPQSVRNFFGILMSIKTCSFYL